MIISDLYEKDFASRYTRIVSHPPVLEKAINLVKVDRDDTLNHNAS